MQRAEYQTRGSVPEDVIECVPFTLPPLATGQARVRMLAASINPSDILTLTGLYGVLPELPAVGGNEGVGVVEAIANDVTRVSVGQTVLMPVGSGTWTSHMNADASLLVTLPGGADVQQMSMLSVNPPTAYLLLDDFVLLAPGEWVIQNAANSAVGSYLTQLAKMRGIKTVNVVRRDSAVNAVKANGGDVVLVDGPDLADRVRLATGKAKIRLGIDCVGGSATDRICQCVAHGGIVVNYGAMAGESCKVSPNSFVFRDVTLRGFWLVTWFRRASAERKQEVFTEMARLVTTGALKVKVQATFPLSQVKEAVRVAAAGERDGKVLLVG